MASTKAPLKALPAAASAFLMPTILALLLVHPPDLARHSLAVALECVGESAARVNSVPNSAGPGTASAHGNGATAR